MEFTTEIKKKRLTGIGGSEIPAILGLSEYSSPYKVWALKTGREAPFTGNKWTTAGSILEGAVSQFFEKETQYRIIKASAKPVVQVHPKYSYVIGMIDRRYIAKVKIGKGVLECKTTQKPLDDPYESWFAQLQWYLGITGSMYGSIAWLERGLDFKFKEYEYDPEFFNYMVGVATEFWETNILKDVPPEPMNVDDIMKMYPRHVDGKAIDATEEMIVAHSELKTVRDTIKTLEQRETELTDSIKFAMRDCEIVKSGIKPLFTWKTTAPIHAFDKDKLKESDPDVYNAYCYEKPGIRKFLIK